MPRHIQSKDFQCKFCDKRYATRTLLSLHTNQTHSTKSWSCDQCDKVFKGFTGLQYHQQTQHPQSDGKLYECHHCLLKTRSKGVLFRHMLLHMLHKDFHCKTCRKGFPTQMLLNNHVSAVHNRPDTYSCLHCDFRTPIQRIMARHECPNVKKYNGALKTNLRPENLYTCDKCNQAFEHSRVLSQHKRFFHIGLLKCYNCDTELAGQAALQKHITK